MSELLEFANLHKNENVLEMKHEVGVHLAVLRTYMRLSKNDFHRQLQFTQIYQIALKNMDEDNSANDSHAASDPGNKLQKAHPGHRQFFQRRQCMENSL